MDELHSKFAGAYPILNTSAEEPRERVLIIGLVEQVPLGARVQGLEVRHWNIPIAIFSVQGQYESE